MDLKKLFTLKIKSIIKFSYNCLYSIKNVGRHKIFCISMQRNGTTSVGKFLDDHGYRTHHYGQLSREWTQHWVCGNYNRIFRSVEFKSFNAYEDNPWWAPDFYRVLYHRFPKAKFILFYRDSNKWFNSMLSHPEIKTLTNTYIHCKIYRKLDIYYSKIDSDPNFKPDVFDEKNHIPFEQMRDHYIRVYEEYNREVKEYFNKYAPKNLFIADLEDKEKWKKLSNFLKVKSVENYNVHITSPIENKETN